ncbi:MAG: pentapeptide repeat-containing protein [Pelatocladus maniniholoensis HA4357-MV3]|jgi:uncharacterized protein YjbI with pentapeptide repeats|uniref:Pentapeptide repeat-containing protein n=1 Tax=Pelatocladus maniniholoensis HA4357-MV3 TaxID=1117104 RepID=A0A9E3HCY5_9NOST|nr:pentapeptide repeat-containing protein [Pelatocladus maniniholoensis HA4357-MV3]
MRLDYSGQNLRGRSFKGQNLTGANFSGADIKGTDFTDTNLRDANFCFAKAGLQNCWRLTLLITLLLIGILALFTAGVVAVFAGRKLLPASELVGHYLIIFLNPIILTIFFILTIYQGLNKALIAMVSLTVVSSITLISFKYFEPAAVLAGNVLWLFGVGVTGTTIFTTVITLTKDSHWILAGAGSIAWVMSTLIPFILGMPYQVGLKVAISSAIGVLTSIYVSQKAVAGVQEFTWIRLFAIAFATTGGTSFRGSDLTDAGFTGATLKNTDFRKANLTRTRFYETKKLDLARVGDTILAKRNILNLLVTGNGRGKNYFGANLKGASLIDADLKEANLKNADINEATFQGANLEWANLTLVQAVGTDFTSAHMTGACVEAWNIESTTKLDNVDCRFIYLLENPKPETDDRERRPSSGEFQPGEFTKLFEEVLNTVDLIFRNGIDWKAFVAAFKQVQVANEDTELALQSIENKGDGVVVVKVAVPIDADKEKIHSDFTQNYQLALQAVEEKYKAQLQAKDNEIVVYRQQSAQMTEIVKLLANKPINVQVDNKLENKNMTNSNDSSRKIEIGSVGRDFNASGQALNLGEIDISGEVTNTINQLPESPEPEKPGIKELLTQLQEAIAADANLSEEDKTEALEQVKTLAEAGQNPQEAGKQKTGKKAITMLKGLVSGLPATATLAEACSKLLPLISKLLGLG